MRNSEKIWKGINNIATTKPKSDPADISLNVNGSITSDPDTVANSFNDFFSSIAEKIKKQIPRTPKNFREFLKDPVSDTIFLNPVTPEEVSSCLNPISPRGAPPGRFFLITFDRLMLKS